MNPQAINEPGTLDVFCQNRRSVMSIERSGAPGGRRVAVVAVGAMLVGSIKYVKGVQRAGAQVQRGECLGAFYYGMSFLSLLLLLALAAPLPVARRILILFSHDRRQHGDCVL